MKIADFFSILDNRTNSYYKRINEKIYLLITLPELKNILKDCGVYLEQLSSKPMNKKEKEKYQVRDVVLSVDKKL